MVDPLRWTRSIAEAWTGAAARLAGLPDPTPELAPTPRDVVLTDGTARLLRFCGATSARQSGAPLLVVPSLINQWYVVDLRPGASLVGALVDAGLDVWCLDWGAPEDEDRHRTWTDVLDRLARMIRRVRRETGAARVGLLGYCMGGTLCAIHAALHPGGIAALVNLVGPIDFANACDGDAGASGSTTAGTGPRFGPGGALAHMVDRRWFDADAIADAGNVEPAQMQAGFVALRPTVEVAKWAGLSELAGDPAAQTSYAALEAWASDNIAFPGEAYRTYITELYQDNRLVAGTHRVRGRAVLLGAITCPTLAIVAERDAICPPAAATALVDRVGATDTAVLRVPGGHVGAVVGSRAATHMLPALVEWLRPRLQP